MVSVCARASRGSIGLKSSGPAAEPAIRHRLFDDPDDLTVWRAASVRCGGSLRRHPLANIVTAADPAGLA